MTISLDTQEIGIGAELMELVIAQILIIDDQQLPIMQNDIKLRVAPTITSREFECHEGLPGLTLMK